MTFRPADIEPYVPDKDPWAAPECTQRELIALKALAAGNANEFQQQLCLAVIIRKFAGGYDMSFRPGGSDGERATAFAEGKRFVASRIVRAIDIPLKPGEPHGPRTAEGRSEPTPAEKGRRNPKPEAGRTKPGPG